MRKIYLFIALLIASVSIYDIGIAQSAQAATFANVVIQSPPGPTVAQKFAARARTSWPWFLVRASGIVAAGSLVLLMLSGIGQITGDTFRFLEPLTAWASHRALGITFAISVLIHVVGLLFDTFVPFTILQLLVPWLSHYKPVTVLGIHLGSLYVALGVLALYGVALVVISSFLWMEKKPYLWKTIHLFSYMLLVFVFIHALYLGTDLAHGVLRIIWIVLAAIVGVASLYRLWRAHTI